MLSKKYLKSSSYAKKRRKTLYRRSIFFLISLACLLVGLIFLFRADFWRIKNIEIEGNDVVSNEEILNSAKNFLSGNFLWVLPKDNIIFYPAPAIKKALMENFPRIKEVKTETKSLTSVKISVSERKPAALWCRMSEESDLAFTNDCFFVDDDGVIFAKAPNFSGGAYFKYYGNLTEENPVGKSYSQNFGKLTEFAQSVNSLRDGAEITLWSKGEGEYEFHEKSGSKIIWNDSAGFNKVFENMQSFFTSSVYAKALSDKKGGAFEYFDFRFGNKVYFK